MIPGRPDDGLAIGFAYTGISDRVHAFDVDFGEPAQLRGSDRDLLYLSGQAGLDGSA